MVNKSARRFEMSSLFSLTAALSCFSSVIYDNCALSFIPDALNSILSDYEVLPLSGLQLHSVRKRDVHTQSHLERLVSFRALHRYSSDFVE